MVKSGTGTGMGACTPGSVEIDPVVTSGTSGVGLTIPGGT